MDIGKVERIVRVNPQPFPEQHPENDVEEPNPLQPVETPEPEPVLVPR